MTAKNLTNEQGRQALLALRKIGPFVPASLTVTQRKCGRPSCRCAKGGPLHETALLTWKEGAVTHTLHVPRELRAQARQWVDEWKRLKALIAEMGAAQRAFLLTLRKSSGDCSKS